jgi:hypothetical protein
MKLADGDSLLLKTYRRAAAVAEGGRVADGDQPSIITS